MKKTIEFLRREPERRFSLAEIEGMRLIPWSKNGRTLRKLLELNKILLKVKITGTGRQKRYSARSGSIGDYLEAYGAVIMQSHNRSKKNVRNKAAGEKNGA